MDEHANNPPTRDTDTTDSLDDSVPSDLPDILESLNIPVTSQQQRLLATYLDLLLETNKQFNLTAIRDRDQGWARHIIDSLTVVPFMKDLASGAAVIDVGSGGGLPGIPIAIARPDLRLTLLEATGKKARFLERCVEVLGLKGTRVVCDRAETVGQLSSHRGRYDGAVCRAIGPLNVVLELTLPLVRVGGVLWAMKGPKALDELNACGDALAILGAGEVDVAFAYPEGFDVSTVVVTVPHDQPTPKPYPRPPGMPKQSPL